MEKGIPAKLVKNVGRMGRLLKLLRLSQMFFSLEEKFPQKDLM
jgi:hypothetical protein